MSEFDQALDRIEAGLDRVAENNDIIIAQHKLYREALEKIIRHADLTGAASAVVGSIARRAIEKAARVKELG